MVGQEGRRYVKEFIENVVKHYIEETQVEDFTVREAACYSISELASKVGRVV